MDVIIEHEQERERNLQQKAQVYKDLKKQIKEDKDREIEQYLFNPKEFAMNKSILKEVQGSEIQNPNQQLQLLK